MLMFQLGINSRVALDRVFVAVDGGGFGRGHVALEEGVAVGVGVLGGADVGVEGVGGRADGQLLWSHWLSCRDGGVALAELTTVASKMDGGEEGRVTVPICAA